MEARLISERNYWRNKFEKLEESNERTLKELQETKSQLSVQRIMYENLLASWVNLINERISTLQMFDEMKGFFARNKNVFK